MESCFQGAQNTFPLNGSLFRARKRWGEPSRRAEWVSARPRWFKASRRMAPFITSIGSQSILSILSIISATRMVERAVPASRKRPIGRRAGSARLTYRPRGGGEAVRRGNTIPEAGAKGGRNNRFLRRRGRGFSLQGAEKIVGLGG